MPQSRRQRALAFVISVVLCSVMSGSLSLIAKRNQGTSTLQNRPTRMATGPGGELQHAGAEDEATPHEKIGVSRKVEGFTNGSLEHGRDGEDDEMVDKTERQKGGFKSNMIAGAILMLLASMSCAVAAVGAVLLVRGPRPDGAEAYGRVEEGGAPETGEDGNASEGKQGTEGTKLVRDEVDEMTPEEAV